MLRHETKSLPFLRALPSGQRFYLRPSSSSNELAHAFFFFFFFASPMLDTNYHPHTLFLSQCCTLMPPTPYTIYFLFLPGLLMFSSRCYIFRHACTMLFHTIECWPALCSSVSSTLAMNCHHPRCTHDQLGYHGPYRAGDPNRGTLMGRNEPAVMSAPLLLAEPEVRPA